MALNLIEAWNINLAQVFVKFEPSIKVSTLINQNITLMTDEATPQLASADPFEPIVTIDDYNSISKTLTLTWREGVLDPNTSYKIKFSNFRTVSNVVVPTDYIDFSTAASTDPDPEDVPIIPPAVEIIDYTLIPDVAIIEDLPSSGGGDSEDSFSVIETDPIDGEFYLPVDFNNGRITVKFSYPVDPTFLTNSFFRLQSKEMTRRPVRWQLLSTQISQEDSFIYIDLPSDDATPVFNTPGHTYFRINHKYRLTIAKEVSADG